MNLTERAEIRKETFYKLTNSRDVPEYPEGHRNYITNYATSSIDWGINNSAWKFETVEDSTAKFGRYLKATCKRAGNYGFYKYFIDIGKHNEFFKQTMTWSMDVKTSKNTNITIGCEWGNAEANVNVTENWQRFSKTFDVATSSKNKAWIFYGRNWEVGDIVYIRDVQLEYGPNATTPIQAPEDLGWSTVAPVPTPTQRYLWKFEYIYYSDDSVEVTQPTNISIAGVNGQTSHVHFAFADNATGGGFSLTTPKAYMGWYADFNEAASTDPTKYRWSKWKGDQGLPGKPGADGKTSYFHMAYADSADGRTGFSFKESGQQYQGYYTDFTQTSSTDPTKYTWMDRRAGVEVGSKNLLRKTAINAENLKLFGKSDTTVSVVEKDGHQVYKLVVSGSSNSGAYFNGNSDYYNLVKDRSYTFSFWVLTNKDKTYSSGSLGHIQAVNNNSDKVGNDNLHQHTTPVYSTNTIKANTWTKVWCTFKATSNSYFRPFFWYLRADDEIYIYDMMLNEGTIPLSHSLAPEDAQEQIDSKADQALTQEQLNALEAKRLQMETEMKALATLQQVSELETFINNLKKEDLDGRQKIIEITKAIEERVKDIEPIMEYSQKLKFMDTYITQGNGGMIIGKNDSTTKVVVTPDRISFQSGGSEVAYISQRMLHIDNGVFTMSLQLGHYITRAHPKNEYVNATYFVK